jgi:hypothetical protein
MQEYGKMSRLVARVNPEGLGPELPLNPLAAAQQQESKAEEDVLVSDTEEISEYSSLSQAQQPVPMEDDKSPVQEINIKFAKEVKVPWVKSKTILMLKPAKLDVDSPVWLATFEGFNHAKPSKGNKCYVKYYQLSNWEFLPWHPDTLFEIHSKDPVLGVVDKLPKGEKQVRAFFECVQKH